MKNSRTGFEPDKSSRGWLGSRVRWLPGSGYIDGATGTVIAEECRGNEFGWMLVCPDGEEGRTHPNGLLTHTTEVEQIENKLNRQDAKDPEINSEVKTVN